MAQGPPPWPLQDPGWPGYPAYPPPGYPYYPGAPPTKDASIARAIGILAIGGVLMLVIPAVVAAVLYLMVTGV